MTHSSIFGLAIWVGAFGALYFIRPGTRLHKIPILQVGSACPVLPFSIVVLTILACTLPMDLSPVWNGERPTNRNQYELTAEAFLDGRLYMEYEIDPKLLEMENPYDMTEREAQGVFYQWDHAFYNGHYYMYFGVVPVILVFLPWRILTGANLKTYHATQLFVALFIWGVFALFRKIAEKFFPELPCSVWTLASMAVSVLSVWHSIAAPALYCTAVTSGLCMEIWSLYLFFRAVWDEMDETKAIRLAFFGSLLGALAFGCRPPVALANLLALPMLATFLRNRTLSRKLAFRLVAAALPYLIVAIGLMLYNYARFDNPFEFGQSYQLTVADQSHYQDMLSRWDWEALLAGVRYFLTAASGKIVFWGAFITFPMLLFPVAFINRKVRTRLRQDGLSPFVCVLVLTIFLIITLNVLWTPVLGPRSRMDIYWLLGLLAYIAIGYSYSKARNRQRFSYLVSLLSLQAVFMSVFLFLCPHDGNYTQWRGYETEIFSQILTFGHGELLSQRMRR